MTATESDVRAAVAGVTDVDEIIRILDQFLPAGYVVQHWQGGQPHTRSGPRWNAFGPPGSGFRANEPAVDDGGGTAVVRITVAAIRHAMATGHDGETRAELRARLRANPLPRCRECGRTILPEESEISAHPEFHPNCA